MNYRPKFEQINDDVMEMLKLRHKDKNVFEAVKTYILTRLDALIQLGDYPTLRTIRALVETVKHVEES